MATKSMAYDHPAYQARLVAPLYVPATAASTSAFRFTAYTAMKIKKVGGTIKTAGTNDAAGWDMLNGTTSVGGITAGTAAAATALTAFQTDVTLAAGGYLDIKTKAASATLQADMYVEYELIAGADVSA